jgi:alkyldihydroxyacetonephosphate synthase
METGWIRWKDRSGDEPVWRWLAQAFAMPALLATPPRALPVLPPSRLSNAAREQLIILLGASGVREQDSERTRHAAGGGLADQLRLRAGDVTAASDAVLVPRHEADVVAVLKLCAEHRIAVGVGGGTVPRGEHAAVVALDMSELNHVTLDMMSGLAQAEAGITGIELERQLAARGMVLPAALASSTLGGWIAQSGGARLDWLHGMQAATPRGLLAGDLALRIMPGSRGKLGVITRATLRVRALPEKEEYRAWLFPDFASGLAAMRQAMRAGLLTSTMRLSDDGATRFARAGHSWDLKQRLFDAWLALRRFDGRAARLLVSFSGSDREIRAARKRFASLVKKLGALSLGVAEPPQDFAALRDSLLARGTGMESLDISASWSELPSLYVAMRTALKQAMRAQAPLPGAHGLVLCQVGPAWPDGANLRFTWLFPRKLDDEVVQAETIHRAALAAIRQQDAVLERDVLGALKQALDLKAILGPL